MIDMVSISIPFLPELYKHPESSSDTDSACLSDDFILNNLKIGLTGQIDLDETGKPIFSRLRHNFESLPSYFASLAFKVYNGTDFKRVPYIKIVGNPSKLLQGHNVYGPDDLDLCISAVYQAFIFAAGHMFDFLDWQYASLDYLDITYTARVESQVVAQQVLDVMKHIKVGQTKPCPDPRFKTTMYWGKGSRHKVLKCYLKLDELDKQIRRLTRLYNIHKSEFLRRQLLQITSPEVRHFANGAIRFEARLYADWLQTRGLVCDIRTLIDPEYFKQNPKITQRLWALAFADVFKAFEGNTMLTSSEKVWDSLRETYKKPTKSGFSYTKAERLFDLYETIKAKGYEATKERKASSTWSDNMALFALAGISIAHLQTFTGSNDNVIPFVRLVNVDFSNQFPASYQRPMPLHQQVKQNPQLRIVA